MTSASIKHYFNICSNQSWSSHVGMRWSIRMMQSHASVSQCHCHVTLHVSIYIIVAWPRKCQSVSLSRDVTRVSQFHCRVTSQVSANIVYAWRFKCKSINFEWRCVSQSIFMSKRSKFPSNCSQYNCRVNTSQVLVEIIVAWSLKCQSK